MTSRRARLVLVLVVLGVVGVGVFAWEPLYLWLMITTRIDDNTRASSGVGAIAIPFNKGRSLYSRTESFWRGPPVQPDEFMPPSTHRDKRKIIQVSRWTGKKHGWERCWYLGTGQLSYEFLWHHGEPRQYTVWRWGGKVVQQGHWRSGGQQTIDYRGAWLWNVTDQTAPSIPAWMKDDEQWQRALDAQD